MPRSMISLLPALLFASLAFAEPPADEPASSATAEPATDAAALEAVAPADLVDETPPAEAPTSGEELAPEAATSDVTEAPASVKTEASLLLDPTADAALAACIDALAVGDDGNARLCFDGVVAQFPTTTAAERARGGLEILDARAAVASALAAEGEGMPPEAITDAELKKGQPAFELLPEFLKPGRLELAAVGGVYGIWTGATIGILTVLNYPDLDTSLTILGIGGTVVTLSVATAAAGYFVADWLDINQGHAWSTSAGMTWGASYALTMLFAVNETFDIPRSWQDEMNFGLPLLGGAVGAISGMGLALWLRPDPAEVSMMDTGGWVGGFAGTMFAYGLMVWVPQTRPELVTALTYGGFKTAGLLAGALSSQVLRLSYGETLLGDLGAVLGMIACGTATVAFFVSPDAHPALQSVFPDMDKHQFDQIADTATTTSLVVGAGLGIGLTTAGLWAWHEVSGRPIFRDAPTQALSLAPGVFRIVLDKEQKPVFVAPVIAARW